MYKDTNKTRYLTPNEAAARLMVSPVTLRHWALAGRLDFVTTPGGHRRFAEQDVERFAGRQAMATASMRQDGDQRILIVDDEVSLTDSLLTILQGLSGAAQLEVANDGFEAAQKLVTFRPHLVLLDLEMPGLQGCEVCRRIKANPATCEIRVVAMTDCNNAEQNRQAMEAGAEACLAKPLDEGMLFGAIASGQPGVVREC
jgi:excisionase family DNA binding protein